MQGFLVRTMMTAAAVATAAAASAVSAQEYIPFRTRNLSPLVAIFGLPTWDVPAAEHELGLTSEVANHYQLSRRGSEALILDGETWRTGFYYSTKLGDRWSVGFELPVYQQSGGVLDDVIDSWHSAFGLRDGGRNRRSEDELLFQVIDDNRVLYNFDARDRGFGDMHVRLGRRLGADNGFHLNLALKLPTGDEDILAGSGSADWAVTLLRSQQASIRDRAAGFFWGLGLVRPGDAERISLDAEQFAYLAVVGGGLRVLPRFGVKAQLDVHSPFYDTPLDELGQISAQVSLGGWWDMSDRGVVDFAINEDIHASTAPDVVVHLGIRWGW